MLVWLNQRLVFVPKPGSNGMLIFAFDDVTLSVTLYALDFIYLSQHLLIVMGIRWQHLFRQVAIIDSVCQVRALQYLFQSCLLVFHERIEWIEEDSLYLPVNRMVEQVAD